MNEFYAYVFCHGVDTTLASACGKVGLTEEQYLAQLADAWRTWRCPRCNAEASFDDESFDKMHYSEASRV